jgi:hypothetical protein
MSVFYSAYELINDNAVIIIYIIKEHHLMFYSRPNALTNSYIFGK